MDTTRPKISRAAAGLQPSRRSAIAPFIVMDVMQAAAEREAQGHGVIHMEVGQPGTPAPRAALARVAKVRVFFTITTVVLETILGLWMALIMNRAYRGRALVRASVLVPWAIPTAVTAKLWFFIFATAGIANVILHSQILWTSQAWPARIAIIIADVWKTTPFMALLILAALQTVPGDCYEAAAVDGVPPRAVFLRITLPLIAPGVAVAVVFRLLDALRVFDLVYVMTANSRATRTMSVYVREQLIDFQQVGYGSAAATLLFLVIALSTLATLRVLRSSAEDA